MKVVEIAVGSSGFTTVLKLWRAESATLGFMPVGGFEDAARLRCLLGVVDDSGRLAGYAMYRRGARGVVSIVHLCVAAEARGAGVARLLFDGVKAACAECFEIRLRCRRDFAASALWPKLGFVAARDVPGRARGETLTIWRYELASLPLLGLVRKDSDLVRVVIDANVFLDLDDADQGDAESLCLSADWLGEFVELAVTQELLNEINRRDNPAERERQRARASRFIQVDRDIAREEALLPQVAALLSTSATPSSRSDARQVAMTIAAKIPFFVTRDTNVLAAADALDDEFGVAVMAPHELIRRFDELRRENDYRPRRLFFGPAATASVARSDELEQIADLLHVGQSTREPRRRTTARLREVLAAPERYETVCIRHAGVLVAAYVIDRSTKGRLTVPFFGVAGSSLGRTAARHYGDSLVMTANREGRRVVEVHPAGLRAEEALADLSFSKEGDVWVKLTLPFALPAEGVANAVGDLASSDPPAAPLARRIAAELRAVGQTPGIARARAVDVERALWPAKITSTGLPCFLVPIQPRWAKELFDRELAEGTLFGANPKLVLNSENVYYRSARPEIVTAPARLLWYVSEDRAFPQSMAVRACSYIDEVVVAPPKELFRRFRRLGVYEWKDVYTVAKMDVTTEIMAFRFSKTELFAAPIEWPVLQDVLRKHRGKRSQIQSPIAISESCFFDLYRRGVCADAA